MDTLAFCIFTAPYLPEDKSAELESLLKENKLDYLTLYGRFGNVCGEEEKIPIYIVTNAVQENRDILFDCAECCKQVGTYTILVKDIGKYPYYFNVNTVETETLPSYLKLNDSKYTHMCEVYFETIAFNEEWIHKILEFKGISL